MQINIDHSTQVCICGAGPVGLLLGNLLGKQGFRVTILERQLHRPTESMAIGVTPPSLKILEQLNLADTFQRQGLRVQDAVVYEDRCRVGALSFARLRNDYRFILSLPQSDTIRILETHLKCYPNVRIIRGVRLDRVRQAAASVECTVWNVATASYESLEAGSVIGCDGVHSRVRQEAGIKVRTHKYSHAFLMADVDDHSGLGCQAGLFFGPQGTVESFPLPGQCRRWIVQLDGLDEETLSKPDVMEQLVMQRSGFDLSACRKRFQSHFSVQRMLARHYYDGRIILCGDAAHAMSPVGGQGMNIGFGDAALLAETLTCSQPRSSRGPLLRQYEQARQRAARVAASRAERNMWIGTRRGPIWSKLRRALLDSMLRRSEALHLAEHFAMLTLPRQQEAALRP